MKLALLLETGFEEIEALTVVDILRRAEFDIDMVSATNSFDVVGAHKISIKVDKLLSDEIMDYDMVILPGGIPGSTNLRDNNKVINLIKYFNDTNRYIGAICAAPIVLQRAGIIKNRKLTSYPQDEYYQMLKEANYQEDNVVIDGKLITSRGPATAFDFAYAIVDLLGGDSTPLKDGMLYK